MSGHQLNAGDKSAPNAPFPSGAEAHRLDVRAKHLQGLNPSWTYTQALKLAISEASVPVARASAVPVPVRPVGPEGLEALRALEAMAQARAAALPAPPKPMLADAGRSALAATTIEELESAVGYIKAAAKTGDFLPKLERTVATITGRASKVLSHFSATAGQPPTARMIELASQVSREAAALLAARAAAESAQRLAGK